ncbi:unnamed protein product [Zymoseptoria tritici ST99CH_3D7]|uniref:Uncharacterized protein n=1 Tax=Zymoseptoria tritici (strain ST99CH_3D7) TaxID=1276538 RepID=A0A1X7RDW6_ZYMT9|nr:unnamed protein product [Zymoseptoria tritici ST99CH_3D7]
MHFTDVIGLVAATMGTLTCAVPVSSVEDIAAPAQVGKRTIIWNNDFAAALTDAKRDGVYKRGGDGNTLWIKEDDEKEEEDPFADALAEAEGEGVRKRGGDGNTLWIKEDDEKEEEDPFADALAEAEGEGVHKRGGDGNTLSTRKAHDIYFTPVTLDFTPVTLE